MSYGSRSGSRTGGLSSAGMKEPCWLARMLPCSSLTQERWQQWSSPLCHAQHHVPMTTFPGAVLPLTGRVPTVMFHTTINQTSAPHHHFYCLTDRRPSSCLLWWIVAPAQIDYRWCSGSSHFNLQLSAEGQMSSCFIISRWSLRSVWKWLVL